MSVFKSDGLIKIIPKNIFEISKIEGKTEKEILILFKGRKNGAYYIDKFINYLNEYYGLSLEEYIEKYFNEPWPTCPISGEKLGYKISGKGVKLSRFKKGKISKKHCPAFRKACERFSKERVGKNNPMYGKKAWNKGLNKNTDIRINKISVDRKGIKFSKNHIQKLKESRKNHPKKARHVQKHSEESKEKMRMATSKRWENGVFCFRKTSIEKKVEKWLEENKLNFIFQFSINGFVADFACEKEKIVIECQGDWFHCNPAILKYSIPKYEVQKRNIYRDGIKKEVYEKEGWKLIELWESDINSGEFKDILKCKLKKLLE